MSSAAAAKRKRDQADNLSALKGKTGTSSPFFSPTAFDTSTPAASAAATRSSSEPQHRTAAPNGDMDVVMTPITGDGLRAPTASLSASHPGSASSSLPPSLSTSVLPLPFAGVAAPPSAAASLASESSSSMVSPEQPSPALIALVDSYAHRLHLPPPHARLTLRLIHRIVSQSASCPNSLHANTAANHAPWTACCIWYSLLLLSPHVSSPSALSFTQLLITFSLSVPAFSRHLDHVAPHLLPVAAELGLAAAEAVKQRVDAFQARLLFSVALYKKYEKLYSQLISAAAQAAEEDEGGRAETWKAADLDEYGCGWLLYLVVKAEIGAREPHALYLQLQCVLRLLLCCRLQRQKARPSTDRGAAAAAQEQKEPPAAADSLSDLMDLSLQLTAAHDSHPASTAAAVSAKYREQVQPLLSQLQQTMAISFSQAARGAGSECDIFSGQLLDSNITSLGHLLDSRAAHGGLQGDDACEQLDERIFLMDRFAEAEAAARPEEKSGATEEGKSGGMRTAAFNRRLFADFTGSSRSPSSKPAARSDAEAAAASSQSSLSRPYGAPAQLTDRPHPHHAFSPSLRGHQSGSQPAGSRTPITRMMEAISWLNTAFASFSPSPSPTLVTHCAALLPDPLPKLLPVVTSMTAGVAIHDLSVASHSAASPSSSQLKRELALKLYWFVLDRLVAASPLPSLPLPQSPPPPWLLSRSFHAALLCLCFELILFAYKHGQLCFPHSLSLFKLSCFDYLKVADTALRFLPTLPPTLRSHLCDVELSIVEKRAWAKGEKAVDMMRDEQTRARVEKLMKQVINNPGREGQDAADRAEGSASSPDFSALLLLYRKLLSLCADRMSYLCSDLALGLTTRQHQAAWTLLAHAVLCHPSLLFHRHADCLLLCSLYTVAVKICHAAPDFKRIIHLYLARWESQAADVVRAVAGREDGSSLTIIAFYNELFIPTVKYFTLDVIQPQLADAESAASSSSSSALPPLSPLPPRTRHAPVSQHPTIYIGPMRSGAPSPSPQRRTVLQAVVGESPTKRLQEMNAMLEGRRTRASAAAAAGRGEDAGSASSSSSKALFRDESGRGHVDGVEALLLASGLNGHRRAE